jgi:hypothetical protein
MVDLFESPTNTGRPAVDIVRVMVLQNRANALESLEAYFKYEFKGVAGDQSVLRARLITWFMEHQSYLERSNTTIKERIEELLFREEELTRDEIKEVFYKLNNILDTLRITRLDTHKVYDRSNIEEDNKENDL